MYARKNSPCDVEPAIYFANKYPPWLARVSAAKCRVISCLMLLSVFHVEANGQTMDANEHAALRGFLESTIADAQSFEDRYDAEVWLVDMSNRLTRFIQDPQQRLELLRNIHSAAARAEVSPQLVLAIIEVESHFDRFAVSSAGAQGMMQVMPFWKDEIGRPGDNLTLTKTNLEYGCRILQFYLQRENQALHRATARYNGSVGSRRYSEKVYRAWAEHWRTEPLDWSE